MKIKNKNKEGKAPSAERVELDTKFGKMVDDEVAETEQSDDESNDGSPE